MMRFIISQINMGVESVVEAVIVGGREFMFLKYVGTAESESAMV